MRSILCSCALVCLLAGCPSPEGPPPLFNAVDRSIVCEPGRVGWDFSTGGFEGDVRNGGLASNIRILEATFGQNCGSASGNWSERFAASCNGNVSCSRQVRVSGDPDPNSGCAKQFRLRYACGVEERTYEVNLPSEASDRVVDIRCGDIINIARASYGKNCNANLDGNLTGRIAGCSGARRCVLASGNAAFGGDPAPGCAKDAEFRFFCGNSREEIVRTFREGEPIDFQCPIPTATEPSAVIRVDSATYGLNCNGALIGNANAVMRRACDGRGSCRVRVRDTVASDPAGGCAKRFDIDYTCTNGMFGTEQIPAEAFDREVELVCREPFTIVSASYGANVGAPADNFGLVARAFCGRRGKCSFPERGNTLFARTLPGATTLDPAPGRSKRWSFTYLCGADAAARTVDFGENDEISFSCAPAAPKAVQATGIRIVSATQGANCPGVDVSTLRNNALSLVTSACFGRDTCDYQHNGIGYDPVPNCAKDLDISYRCGSDPEVTAVKLSAESGTLRLSCAPSIRVTSATFGLGCRLPDGNVGIENNAVRPVGDVCTGKRGQCSFQVGPTLGDPFPGCAKNFSARYTCGVDPTVRRIDFPAEASGQTATFTCPDATGVTTKACVPEQCRGRTRRGPDLACLPDLTKPIVGSNTSWALATPTGTTFRENTPATLWIETLHGERFSAPQFVAGANVANGTLWASDRFWPKSGSGPSVEGFRCLVATVGLQVAGGAPGSSRSFPLNPSAVLKGSVENTVMPQGCFGLNITSWRDAAKRVGLNEVAFRAQYSRQEQSTLRLSFDAEGRTVAKRTPGTSETNALVPNPIGFYYDAAGLWVDSFAYYQQTEVTAGSRPVTFQDSTAIVMTSQRATVRTPELSISITEEFQLPALEVDFAWALEGDAPGRNPFSMEGPKLVSSIDTLADRRLGATIEITTKTLFDTAVQNGRTWVEPSDAMIVGARQGTLLRSGVPAGKTERLVGAFTPALRQRMLRVRNGSNGGWMGSATEAQGRFRVRVCIDVDGSLRTRSSDEVISFSASRGDTSYTAGTRTNQRCVVAPLEVILRRDLTVKPLRSTEAQTRAESGSSTNQGDSAFSAANDFGAENSCQRQCTVDADCGGGGRRCERARPTDALGLCSGDAPSGSECRALQRQSMASGGQGQRSQLSMTTATESDRTATTAQAESAVSAEMLGFTILDSSGEGQEEEESPISTGWQRFSISLVPNFSVIEKAFAGKKYIPRPVKEEIEQYRLERSNGIERDGLSVGIQFELTFFLGPVPVMVEFGAAVGLGMGLQLEVEMNKEQEGESNSPLYPCWGTTRCVRVNRTPATLEEAARSCQNQGGRLAEAQDAGVNVNTQSPAYAALAEAARMDTSAAFGEYWIGAQAAYLYSDPVCWEFARRPDQTPASCVGSSTTRYQWVSNAATFAEQGASGVALLSFQSNAFGGTRSDLDTLRTRVPRLAGLTLRKGNGGFLRTQLASDSYRSLCEFEPARSYDATKISVAASIEISAGAGFAVCVPTNVFGLCVAAEVKFIFAEISAKYENSNIELFRPDGRLMGIRQNHTLKGEWQWGFMSGGVRAELRLVFTNLEWDIVKYEGAQTALVRDNPNAKDLFRGVLFNREFPSRKDFP